MNVTAANAESVLEQWSEFVDKCEFYTVDQEMTGIDGSSPLSKEDPLEKTYLSVSQGVKKYSAFQFGICLFERKDKASSTAPKALGNAEEYVVRPFSFWLLNDFQDVTLNTSGVKFLLANKMNYQFWLENGFAYGPTDVNACPKWDDLTAEEKAWIEREFAAIGQWYDNAPAKVEVVVTPPTGAADKEEDTRVMSPASPTAKDKDEYFLETYVSARADVYLHYLLYAQTTYIPFGQTVPERIKTAGRKDIFNATPTRSLVANRDRRYPRCWFHRLPLPTTTTVTTTVDEEGNTVTTTTTKSVDPTTCYAAPEDHPINQTPLRSQVSFHNFFKTLVESKKPHVGHNYFTDLMFQVNQHWPTQLPPTYSDFRSLIGELFPQLYDTKVLCSVIKTPLKNTSLGQAFAELGQRAKRRRVERKFKFPVGFNNLTRPDLQCAHDGSYDAFMTGVVFLYALNTSPATATSKAVNAIAAITNNADPSRTAESVIVGAAEGDEFPEGVATYEGVVAQFMSGSWMAVRREDKLDVPCLDVQKARSVVMDLYIPPPPANEESA